MEFVAYRYTHTIILSSQKSIVVLYIMARIKLEKIREESRQCKRKSLQDMLTVLNKKHNGVEASFEVLRSRYKQIWKRHNSFPDEVRLSRFTVGKMPQLGDEITNSWLSIIWHFRRHSLLVKALKFGISKYLLVRKQGYEESHKRQVELLKRINKLMETALGSCAA